MFLYLLHQDNLYHKIANATEDMGGQLAWFKDVMNQAAGLKEKVRNTTP
jgi:hypothetical protein